ncbi:MAG: tyrosine-type recombinase/integrase [Bacteroidia bacterium]|nr:tyrosine-type recombinase/integrase [Bacteroidia bacterium]
MEIIAGRVNPHLFPFELDELIEISSKKDLGSLTIDDLHNLERFLKKDKQHDNFKKLKVIHEIIKTIEQHVADTMCGMMTSKSNGLVFDYLDSEDFKNLRIMDKRELNEDQTYKLHRARCQYNSRLKRIAKDIEIEKLTSHVSRHSFAYFMLSSGATVEEISHANGHSTIEMTQNYLKQFPSKYSDNAIKKFESGFEI